MMSMKKIMRDYKKHIKKGFVMMMASIMFVSNMAEHLTQNVYAAVEGNAVEKADDNNVVTETNPDTVELTTDKDGVISLKKYTGTAGKVDIQALFPDKKILTIGERAFSGNKIITEIVIPPSVITINSDAFSNCSALKTVIFAGSKEEQSLQNIGDYAFSSTAVQNITLPDTVTTLGKLAFGHSSIRSITIPASCMEIGADSYSNMGTFAMCSALEEVIFAERTQEITIGEGAFYNCPKLVSINLPEQLTSISDYMFEGCGFNEITIPSGVSRIGEKAFMECRSLNKVTFKSPNTVIDSFRAFEINSKLVFCCDLKADGTPSTAEEYAREKGIRFVRPAKNISIKQMPKTELFYGDAINVTTLQSDGLVLQAEFDSSVAPTTGIVSINDCLISGYNPEQIGEQQVTITYGTASVSYPVQVNYDLSKVDISYMDIQYYTGKPIEPEFALSYNNIKLEKDKDYIVSYSEDHKNIGTVTVTFVGKGSYRGTITETFDIVRKSLEDKEIKVNVADTVYNTKQQKPIPVVTYGDVTLKEGVDYNITYGENKETGNEGGSVTIIAKTNSNFTGERTIYFDILPKDISELSISEIGNVIYNGERQRPSVSISWDGDKVLSEEYDYELSYSQNVNATTNASVTINGTGNYTGEVVKNFAINPASIQKAIITKKSNYYDYYIDESDIVNDNTLSYIYTGKPIIPNISVYYDYKLSGEMYSNYKLLSEGVDYTVTVENNINPGTATLTITGINNFVGSRSITYLIEDDPTKPFVTPTTKPTVAPTTKPAEKVKKVSLISCTNKKAKKIIAKWKKIDSVSGYEITIAANKKFTIGKKVKTTTKTSYTFNKLKKGKIYYIRVRAYVKKNKKKSYGSYSNVKKIVVKR